MFDNYALKARYYPVVILFFPIVLIGIIYSFEFNSTLQAFTSIGAVGAFTYLFSQLGRDRGKLKENALWKSWGGSPSVQLLRLRNDRLDYITKQRYHKKLQVLCPGEITPSIEIEEDNPVVADQVYFAWTKYLISQTRDVKKFSLLYKDNVSYGFRRNLWGLKSLAILILILLIGGNYLFWAVRLQEFNPMAFPLGFRYTAISLTIFLFFWVFVVTKEWIKVPAFSYAERLCESVEVL